ncbi:MAG: extracellular solute-binding protein [Acidimicrobiia bacterium]|nr:extracellular solute-binding protein [Acidimicrobiia bacterium]MCY4457959.1 extracellular solute-binding protein [Acidimicrobiaceae bacterium]
MYPQVTPTRSKGMRWLYLAALLALFGIIAAACGDSSSDSVTPTTAAATEAPATETPATTAAPTTTAAAPDEAPATTQAPTTTTEAMLADGSNANFVSTQFVPVEEAAKLRSILAPGNLNFDGVEEGPTIAQILAGAGAIDVVGALHGTFPPLANNNALTNMIDVYDDLSADRSFAQSFVNAGLLGTDDFLAYVPWAQATYIMAAHTEALQYLPAGSDIDNLTWAEFADWCQAILDGEGRALCGLPHAGLFHRFLEGYMWPSFTGGMVSEFRSTAAHEMMEWARDSLWPTINPESINYSFMQEPLLAGDVWVGFDHVARLIDAFSEQPDSFVAFPTPSGPEGRGFMPVIVGLGIPADAPNPEEAAAVIEYLTRPDIQAQVLAELAFFPVVEGVDTSSLPAGVALEAEAVEKLANASDALPALLPIGLGERGGEINQIFRNAFDRIVLEGGDIATVLNEEGDALQTLMTEASAPCWAPDPASDGPCVVNPAP